MTATTNPPLGARAWLAGWAVTAIAFGVLDGVWLGVVAQGTYERAFGPLLADPMNAPAAAAFYVIYTLGITHFATAPALGSGSIRSAALQGAALGVVAYATFDLTSLAVIEGYPAGIVPIDMAWGAFATSVAAAAATAVLRGRLTRGGHTSAPTAPAAPRRS
ncbi:DUF2177 family protein [Janibacter cremeus]|uniref:DUF2177 family protein n=1 Tax=Janibacter cremeus TaxID=1285192 RepID=UPI0023F95BB3|nr:DUF2177 family protein [Janibacter cremeus]WEV77516.1 DUF2177 family protein [Janibacter cremeus]